MVEMIDILALRIFDLSIPESKVLNFLFENRDKTDLTYDKIKKQIKDKKALNRPILKKLIQKKFVFDERTKRPFFYRINTSRFREYFEEVEQEHLKTQAKFDSIIKRLEDDLIQVKYNLEKLQDFLQKHFNILEINKFQISILLAIYSKINKKSPNNSSNFKEIVNRLEKPTKIAKIRYNLLLLENKGFISKQKIGKILYYSPNDLKVLVERKKNYQLQTWEDKRRKMLEIIDFLEEDRLSSEKLKDLEVNTFKKMKEKIFSCMKNVEQEVLLDLRCNFGRGRRVISFLNDIFQKILKISRMKKNTNIKLLLKLENWIIYKFDFFFSQLIQKMPEQFKCPYEKIFPRFRIIVDDVIIQILIDQEFSMHGTEHTLIIKDENLARQAKLEFNYIWEKSFYIRDIIGKFKITKELQKVIDISYKDNPPIYNFTDYVGITGFRKIITLLLNLLLQAKKEIVTIICPIYQLEKKTVSYLDIIARENFYHKLNTTLKKKAHEDINIKWIINTPKSNLQLYSDYDSKKEVIDLVLSLYPNFKMKQVDLPQFQFIILDKKYLCVFTFLRQPKLIIVTDKLITNDYYFLFQKIWSIAKDVRHQWAKEASKPIKQYIKDSYNKIPKIRGKTH